MARSVICCASDQRTSIAPLLGEEKLKVYGPAPEPTTWREGTLLIRREFVSTPKTGSVKVTRIWVRERTVTKGGGSILATAGGTLSGVE